MSRSILLRNNNQRDGLGSVLQTLLARVSRWGVLSTALSAVIISFAAWTSQRRRAKRSLSDHEIDSSSDGQGQCRQ